MSKKIAAQIRSQEGDYVLALKGNLRDYVEDYFKVAMDGKFQGIEHDYHETTDGGHGRVEVRRHWTINEFGEFPGKTAWRDLSSIGMVESERHIKGKVTTEQRYYISSSTTGAKQFAASVRSHWGVENGLHWCMDVGFREDDCRVRKGYASENFSVVRHIAMNLLKQEKTAKGGIKARRLLAGWDQDYMKKVIGGLKN